MNHKEIQRRLDAGQTDFTIYPSGHCAFTDARARARITELHGSGERWYVRGEYESKRRGWMEFDCSVQCVISTPWEEVLQERANKTLLKEATADITALLKEEGIDLTFFQPLDHLAVRFTTADSADRLRTLLRELFALRAEARKAA